MTAKELTIFKKIYWILDDMAASDIFNAETQKAIDSAWEIIEKYIHK